MRALPLAFSLVFTLTAAAAQNFPIAQPRLGPAPYHRDSVEIAASNEQYLVVWHDGREQWRGRSRGWAARVSRAGALLDPAGIPVGQEHIHSFGGVYSVASNGTDFLVATIRGNDPLKRGDKVELTKITRDGIAESAPDLGITAWYANLVSIGDGYALFYNENLGIDGVTLSTRGKVVILDRDGHLLTPSVDFIVSSGQVWDLTGALSDDGATVMIVWKDTADGRVHAKPVATSSLRAGTATLAPDIDPTPATQPAYDLSITRGNDRYFVSWIQGTEYRGRVLNMAGAPVGGIITIATTSIPTSVEVAWSGSRFVAAYASFESVDRFLRISEFTANGIRSNDVDPRTMCWTDVSIAAIGGDSLVAWEGWDSGGGLVRFKIRADIFDASSQFKLGEQPLLVSRSAALRTDAKAVWRGTHFLAAWRELSDVTRVAFARFGPTGPSLDPEGVLLGSAGASPPSVATDGQDALIAWTQSNGAYVAHVSASGIATPRQITNTTGVFGADVVWNGEEYAACAGKTMVRLGNDGAPRQISTVPAVNSPTCHLSWSGSQYLLLWTYTEICFPVCEPPTSLWAQAVSRDLTPLGAAVQFGSPNVASEPKTAVAGDRMLVVWVEKASNGLELRGKRITASGVILDAASFKIGDASSISDIFAEGENWVVVSGPYTWTVSRSGHAGARETRYPFVPIDSEVDVVASSHGPMIVFQADDGGRVPQLFGRFLGTLHRRSVRH